MKNKKGKVNQKELSRLEASGPGWKNLVVTIEGNVVHVGVDVAITPVETLIINRLKGGGFSPTCGMTMDDFMKDQRKIERE